MDLSKFTPQNPFRRDYGSQAGKQPRKTALFLPCEDPSAAILAMVGNFAHAPTHDTLVTPGTRIPRGDLGDFVVGVHDEPGMVGVTLCLHPEPGWSSYKPKHGFCQGSPYARIPCLRTWNAHQRRYIWQPPGSFPLITPSFMYGGDLFVEVFWRERPHCNKQVCFVSGFLENWPKRNFPRYMAGDHIKDVGKAML